MADTGPLIKRRPYYRFRQHRHACATCQDVNLDRPATLARACQGGAALIKRAANFAYLIRPRSAR